jgi:hypothetical protein
MHQYAYAMRYARGFGIDCVLPSEWEGTRLFEDRGARFLTDDELRRQLNLAQPRHDNLEARAKAIEDFNRRTGSDFVHLNPDDPTQTWSGGRAVFVDSLCAYHPAIFENMSRAYLKDELFPFSEEVQRTDFFKRHSDRRGTYDVAHLRRDDIANPAYNRSYVQGYSVLSKESYLRAFRKFGFDPQAIEWVSDDYLRRWHTDRPPSKRGGWTYPVGSQYLGPDLVFDWLPDFIRLYFARTIFRANSSFSWWAAFLSPTAKVFSPVVSRQSIYGRDSCEEVDYDFVEGNRPHWMHGLPEIRFREDVEDEVVGDTPTLRPGPRSQTAMQRLQRASRAKGRAIARLMEAKLGRCRSCMAASLLLALVAWVVAGACHNRQQPALVVLSIGVAIAFSELLLMHAVAYGVRRAAQRRTAVVLGSPRASLGCGCG